MKDLNDDFKQEILDDDILASVAGGGDESSCGPKTRHSWNWGAYRFFNYVEGSLFKKGEVVMRNGGLYTVLGVSYYKPVKNSDHYCYYYLVQSRITSKKFVAQEGELNKA